MSRLLKVLPLLVIVAALFSVATPSFAQSQPTITTLSAAQSSPLNGGSGSTSTISVASATGITASTKSQQSFVLIDSELEEVSAVSGTTLTVRRARSGLGAAHVSGAYVVFGYTGTFNPNQGTISSNVGSPTVGASNTGATFIATLPVGSCTRSNMSVLPVFVVSAHPLGGGLNYGYTADCLNGKWAIGTLPDNPSQKTLACASNVPIGSVAYSSFGTNTTGVNNQEWLTSIWVPQTCYVTGVKVLSGGTSTTDNIVGLLRDAGGNIIANAAAAGVTLSGANTFQTQAFVNKTLVVGPALYYIGVQTNGTNAGDLQTVAASTFIDVAAGSVSNTFGTVTGTVTVPTTFTGNKGPIAYLYY
jgi:hypothetical protein